jgi:hypothetical protein
VRRRERERERETSIYIFVYISTCIQCDQWRFACW